MRTHNKNGRIFYIKEINEQYQKVEEGYGRKLAIEKETMERKKTKKKIERENRIK